MKLKLLSILLLPIMIGLSCDEHFIIVKCSDCIASEPVDAKITVNVENPEDFQILVSIYEGNLEDNILMSSFTIYSNELEYVAQINKKYTFKIEYSDRLGNRYIAVNTVYPRVKFEQDQCPDLPCYYIYDNKINMKLKYR
jgi:hypothetical protein